MTSSEMWAQLLERHPSLTDEESTIKLRSRGLRNLLDQAWDEGMKAGSTDGTFDSLFGQGNGSNPFKDLFGKGGPFT